MGRFGGKGDNARNLYSTEIKLIERVFSTARLPSWTEVSIADGLSITGTAWTDSDYEMNVGPHLYGGDLSILEPSTLVHEMVHVWQYYNGTLTKAHAFKAHVVAGFRQTVFKPIQFRQGQLVIPDSDYLYTYDLDGSWDDMGFEGQAQLVED